MRKLIAETRSSLHRILEVDDIEVYIEKTGATESELRRYEEDPHFRTEYIEPIKDALAYYRIDLSPSYLLLTRTVPRDPGLFANAFNDGIVIYANPRNVALGWKWIAATTLIHEIGHIADSQKRGEPILLLTVDSLEQRS